MYDGDDLMTCRTRCYLSSIRGADHRNNESARTNAACFPVNKGGGGRGVKKADTVDATDNSLLESTYITHTHTPTHHIQRNQPPNIETFPPLYTMSKRTATTFSQSDDVKPTIDGDDDDNDNYKSPSTSPKKSKPNSNFANRLSKEQKQILIGMALDGFLENPNWQAMSDAVSVIVIAAFR
jgi:hypothetical protein